MSGRHEPTVSRSTARHCGTCGARILFDPSTMKPVHIPEVPRR